VTNSKIYQINRVLVEATLSEGGRFYDIKVIETGARMRYLAEIFRQFAKAVPK